MSEYDVRNVYAFVRDARAALWPLVDRFEGLGTWEKANVLFTLAEDAGKLVTRIAKNYARRARREDGE